MADSEFILTTCLQITDKRATLWLMLGQCNDKRCKRGACVQHASDGVVLLHTAGVEVERMLSDIYIYIVFNLFFVCLCLMVVSCWAFLLLFLLGDFLFVLSCLLCSCSQFLLTRPL